MERAVVWLGENGEVGIRNLPTGKDGPPFPGSVSWAAFLTLKLSADGSMLSTFHQVWDAITGEALVRDFRVSDNLGSIAPFAPSPDGRLVYWAGGEGIHAWERITRENLLTFGPNDREVEALALSPDGRVLAAACHDGSIRLLDAKVGPAYGMPQVARTTQDFESLWQILGGTDAEAANAALWSLATVGDPAVQFLSHKLAPVPALTPVQLADLRAKLREPDMIERQTAARTLLDNGTALQPAELAAARPHFLMEDDMGVMRELPPDNDPGQPDLRSYSGVLGPLPDRLRSSRAVSALANSTVPAARRLLESLATGAAEDLQTQEAARAL